MNTEKPEEMMESYTKTLSINLFGQLLLVTTLCWVAECQLPVALQPAQRVFHAIAFLFLLGTVVTNLFTVYCAYLMRNLDGYQELAALSLRSITLLTALQLSMYFFTPAPFKLLFMAAAIAMILRWSRAKGKFLWPSDFRH